MIQVKSELQQTGGKIIYKVFHEGGREHYNLKIYLDAPSEELNQIDYVEYTLHPSFTTPVRKSKDRSSGFSIELWTWGMFEINVGIHYRDGRENTMPYELTYSLPADDGTNYQRI